MADGKLDVPEHHIDGESPGAEVGPEECEASVTECEIQPGEREDSPVPGHTVRDEIDDAFLSESLATPIAEDGLPDNSVDPVFATHPFTYDSVCCVEDDRSYVELFNEEIFDDLRSYGQPYTKLLGTNKTKCRDRYDPDGVEVERRTFEPEQVVRRWGVLVAFATDSKGAAYLVPVRPVRPACSYYKRQHFANDDYLPGEPGHHLYFRNCTHPARRSIGGAAMSLRDEAVYGCDYRDPADPVGMTHLNEHDRKKLRERPDQVFLPLFGIAGEAIDLRRKPPKPMGTGKKPDEGDEGAGGIFNPRG